MSLNYSKVVLLCYWGLLCASTHSVYGVAFKVQGISLTKLLDTNPGNLSEIVEIDKTASYIHEMLKNYPWAECSLETTKVDILNMDRACSDTDDSISSKAETNKQKRFYQRTKNLKANNRKGGIQFECLKETYIKLGDINLKNDDPTETTETISNYLSEEATKIVWGAGSKKAAAQTTCLCVMLRDKHKRVKQLVFHNLKNYLPSAMHNMAVEIGIGMRGNEQMHAEASFLGFLLHRAEKEEYAYTHVLGMGCSKKHCQECDALLKLFLGSNYQVITAAAVQSSNEAFDFFVRHPSESDKIEYFRRERAKNAIRIKNNPSEKYLLSEDLKRYIRSKKGLDSIPIDTDRFRDVKRLEANQNTKPPALKRQKKGI